MSCGKSSIGHRGSHARTAPLTSAIFFAAPAPMHHWMFGALAANINAIGRIAKSQSGCLPYGSLLTNSQRKSATRHRQLVACPSAGHGDHAPRHLSACHHQVSRASFGAQRTETALPRSTSIRQNLWKSNQGSVVMQRPSINSTTPVGMFSTALASAASLTGRCSRRSLTASLRHGLMGAAELGR